MEFIGVILLISLLYGVIKGVNDARDRKYLNALTNLNPPAMPKKFPLWRRVYYFLIRLLYSRRLSNFELNVDISRSESNLEILFYVPRRIIDADIIIPDNLNLAPEEIRFEYEDGAISKQYGMHMRVLGNQIRTRLLSPKLGLISKIILIYKEINPDIPYEVQVKIPRRKYKDMEIIDSAIVHYNANSFQKVRETLLEYLQYSTKNPAVFYYLADACDKLNLADEFEEYILKSMAYGFGEMAGEKYRQHIKSNWFLKSEATKDLLEQRQEWALDQHHGLVVLQYEQTYYLGLNNSYLKRTREVIEIRRPVAARMLSRLAFDFSSNEFLIFSACRIIKSEGEPVDLPLEQFVVGDSQERNIYITTMEEKTGAWILPDLSSGDIIELCYYIISRENFKVGKDRVPLAIVDTVHHPLHPTLTGISQIKMPLHYELHCSIRDDGDCLKREESTEGNYKITKLSIRKYIPVKNTHSYYESYHCNPVVAFTTGNKRWPEIASAVLRNNFGNLDELEELPEPLAEIISDGKTSDEKLRRSFYWIRDKLKYAATDSAIKKIGDADRGAAIMRSGVADCKDKSYLLFLVCKNLGLETQLIAVSSRHGLVFHDLPSDQFDHVFVKTRLHDRWHYLDAASRNAVFDSCPPLYQGLDTLVITENGGPETIMIDPPSRNRISITETLDRINQDWLSGTFHIRAEGNIARLVDENWKAQSLQALSQLQASQSVLRNFLPSAVLISFDRLSHTAYSDAIEVLGMHNRCQLSAVGNKLIGTIEWTEPTTPTGYWRNYSLDQAFVFYQPTIIDINVVLTGDLPNYITDVSDSFSLSNGLCDITIDFDRQEENIVMKRRIIIKEKYVNKSFMNLIPPTMEGIEKAFQMAIVLDGVQQSAFNHG